MVAGIVGCVVTAVLYWIDAYTIDWYEVVFGYWWLAIPVLGALGWTVVMAQEGEMGMVDVD